MGKMRRLVGLLVCLVWVVSARAETPPDAMPTPSLDDFLSSADMWWPEMSPSGQFLVVVGRASDENPNHIITVIDLDSETPLVSRTSMGNFLVNWVEWASDDRILVSLTGYLDPRRDRVLSPFEDFPKNAEVVGFSRLVAIDRDGQNTVTMFGDSRRISRNTRLSSVTSFLPQDPDHIIMPAYLGGDLDLFKVNVRDGSHEEIARGTGDTYLWYVDREGEPAFRFNTNRRGTVIYVYAREDRQNGSIRWRKTNTIRINRNRDNRSNGSEFIPLAPGPDVTNYYVAARPDGQDTMGLYLYDFETDTYLETLKIVDGIDVTRGLFDRETGNFLGSYYWDDRLVLELEDPNIQSHIDGLNAYFGDEANVIPVGSSRNGQRWLLMADGPREPGTYHIYDIEQAFAQEIGARYFDLLGKQMSQTQTIHYTARDGLALRGYLTRPANPPPGTPPPLIMLPHGGPEARDYIQYDRQVQYLASLGYQVFQPNFRGSSGFGQAFVERGRREFGGAMQTDVEDGFRHLVDSGLADADQACIMGYSYGGYVAMAAATLTPDLYQCAIAGSGPSDLVKFLNWERREEGRSSEAYQYWVEQIGHPRQDKAALQAVSPALLAENVEIPLLLIHGSEDYVVPIEQSEYMEEAMQDAGKSVQFLRLEESGHSYRPRDERRLEYETLTAFLREHLPVQGPLSSTAETSSAEASTAEP